MFRMEVYETDSKKTLIITAWSFSDCLADLAAINSGMRQIAEEEPKWSSATVWGYKGCEDIHAEVHNKPVKTICGNELVAL